MRYLGNNSSNVLGLRNLNTGNQLKAGDQTVLRYRLADANNDVLNLQGQTAKVFLKQSGKTIHLTTVDVTQDLEVRFAIDNVLYPGSYELEIVVADNYFFPSDNSERIIIYPSYLSLVDEEIEDIIQAGDTTLADVREYIMTFVQNAIDNSTYVAGANVTIDENNVISAIDHELRDLVKTKQDKLVAGDNIELDADGKISAVDTVYDDTEVRRQLDDKQESILWGENIIVDKDGTIHAVDTVYDDSDVRSKLEDVQDSITWGENIVVDEDGTVHAVDNDTVYDDTKIKQQLDSVSQHIDELIRGDITIQEFIDRLTVLEADMRTIKQRTSTLVSDMDALEAIVDNIGDVDLSDILTVLDTVQADILELERNVGDTTLATDVANIQSFISELSNKVDGLIYVGPQPVDSNVYQALTHILADIANLYSQLEGGVPADYDESELIARIESLEGIIDGYIAEGVYDDQTLQKHINEVMAELNTFEQYVDADLIPTIGQLNDSLADIEVMRDDMLDLITSDVAELRQQVNALDNYVSDMATEYSIRALTDRMEELENIAYYFEGASEDVQNWLFENNAKALRFSGEGVYDPENIWLMADEYVHYNSHTDSSARLGDYMNSIMSSYNLPYDINYKKMYNFGDTISNSTQVVRIMSAIFNKSTVDLSDKILSFRMNPLFFSGKPISVVLFITDYVDEQGNVFDYKVSINSDEVDAGEGQVQIIMPSDYTSLHIYPFRSPTSRGDTTNNQRPVNDITAMGLWVIEDMGEPDGPEGSAP
ncbi:hypothetical protein [Aerococcus urinaeequi]|uniref:hypothetical protein n=1 Tax=Aerococcus urinaeequi TaxID=51665 RepID=UPI003D6A1370